MTESTVVRLDLPASTAHLNVLCACLNALLERVEGIDQPQITAYNIELAANEIMANIVLHAYANIHGGRVLATLTLAESPRRLVVELHDTGRSFNPCGVPQPNLEDVQIHGYGLFLVQQLMDDVAYRTGPDGNHWQLTKYL